MREGSMVMVSSIGYLAVLKFLETQMEGEENDLLHQGSQD